MFKYDYCYEDGEKDTCEVCEMQIAYMVALGLTQACTQIGK